MREKGIVVVVSAKNMILIFFLLLQENVRSICGCTVDALRHGFTFEEVEGDSQRVQEMVNLTLPVCIDEERRNL